MTDPRSLLEREMRRIELRPFTLDEFRDRRERKQWSHRIAAGVVGLAVFVAAIWIVTRGGAFERSQTPASTGPTVTGPSVPPTTDPIGLVGLPPEGAKPSTPKRGELLLSFIFGHTGGDPGRFGLNLYADGRLLWQQLGSPTTGDVESGLVEQRLSPEGVELLLSEVRATGLFDHSLYLLNPRGLVHFGQIELREGGATVQVTWGNITHQKGALEVPTTEDQVRALEQLDARLEDPASWLPASAWEQQEPQAYVPSRYSICFEAAGNVGFDRVLASLPASVEESIRVLGLEYREETFPISTSRKTIQDWCSAVTTDQARALAETFSNAEIRNVQEDVFGVSFSSQPRERGDVALRVSLEPLLPREP